MNRTSRAPYPTLISRIEAAATGHGVVRFVGSAATNGGPADSAVESMSWCQLYDDARRVAAALQARGVTPGSHVAIIGPTSRHLVTTIEAIWIAGAGAVTLPLPLRLSTIEEFVAQTRTRILASDAVLVVIDAALAEFLDPQPGDPPIVTLDALIADMRRADDYVRPVDDLDALAILQYTSGSTSDPKGVMLPHRCVSANVEAIARGAELDPDRDVGVSWLPLYHDMGLIGLLATPMCTSVDLVIAPPTDFLASPARWMQWMSDFGGTVTAGPNFSYVLATRALTRLEGLDLSAWRIALNGAEPVDPASVRAFLAAGERHGLRSSAAFPAFGMAEATLAVTFPTPGAGLVVDRVDIAVLERDRYAAPATGEGSRDLARLGRAMHNLEIRVVDPRTGLELLDREVGELEVRGDSVTAGYYKRPELSEAAFHDGWLRTGDLAYLVDGDLVVCGRIKDVINLGGRNVYPQDVERAVNGIHGVRAGNVIAFGTEGRRGKESIVVVAESKAAELEDVRAAISDAVYGSVGMPASDVVLVRPGSLPKTSSGKLQRALCKERYLDSHLELV